MLYNNTLDIKKQFRYYSRRVLQQPSDISAHHHRINIAHSLAVSEPLQGALADMFYGCWYEMPFIGDRVLDKAKSRLRPSIYQAFEQYILRHDYISQVTPLATRWSVLVSPSLNVASHSLLTSSDDARLVANDIVEQLLSSKEEQRYDVIEEIEADFLAHCIACNDLIAFTIVWFRLGKTGWKFDSRWRQCREHLESLSKSA
ncbi:hypothetical protein [Psychrobacter sp. I-STPA6b]|uniref:hypothetical protein n=1 Tax=Psychrobacter sp. I-STPA6b TaxID=2585718 RepID=UPI001D0C5A4B|nr:hypothetical protein [Psychrobacter sp. I-STPA6b]